MFDFEVMPFAHDDVKNGLVKLGRSEAKFDARTPSLSKIVQDLGFKIPTETQRSKLMATPWQMLGNDQYGNCEWAEWAHALMLMDGAEGKVLTFTAAEVIKEYLKYTGGQDNGSNMLDCANLRIHNTWANFGQRKADFFVGLDLGSKLKHSVSASIYLVGTACLGVALPNGMQKDPYNWAPTFSKTDPNWKPGGWGGHAVVGVDFDAKGVWLVTWGKLVHCSWAYLAYIMQEGYGVSHPNFRNRKGTLQNGLTFDQVKKYLPVAA